MLLIFSNFCCEQSIYADDPTVQSSLSEQEVRHENCRFETRQEERFFWLSKV